MQPKHAPIFSPQSVAAGRLRPGRKVLCSTAASWRSVLLQVYAQPASVEAFETTASPDHLFVFCLQGEYRIESFAAGAWHGVNYQPGRGGFTSPMVQNRLRWHSDFATELQVLRLYIPDVYFQEASEELRPSGGSSRRPPDSLLLSSPTAFAVASSLLQQMHWGASDLYADAGARLLAAHMLSEPRGPALIPSGTRKPDRRLQRAYEFLHEHFREDLSLITFAREAGISPFHFAREYKAYFGQTPHRHQVLLRMKHARDLLRCTELSIQEIALECGYTHGGHFAAAFRAEFGISPVQFRKQRD